MTRDHEFKKMLVHTYRPDRDAWHCAKCDSTVLFLKGTSEHEVNKKMMLKLPCVDSRVMNAEIDKKLG